MKEHPSGGSEINMQLNEETCPVPESVLGQLYRASPHGLDALIDTVPPQTRAKDPLASGDEYERLMRMRDGLLAVAEQQEWLEGNVAAKARA